MLELQADTLHVVGELGKKAAPSLQESCVLIVSVAASLYKLISAIHQFRVTEDSVEKCGKCKTALTSEQMTSVLFYLLPLLNGKQTCICQP